MLPSWLTGQTPQRSAHEQLRHAVLGTALNAPLMDDQEEALY